MKLGKFFSASAGVVIVLAAVTIGAPPAHAAVTFEMPFPCGQVWNGNTRGDHDPEKAVDLYRGEDEGDPVVASAAGTVKRVEDRGGASYGKFIEISHGGGWSTLYAHLSQQRVRSGQQVGAGDLIGNVGNTGGSEGPHLHYEQLHHGTPVDIAWGGKRIRYWGNDSYKSDNCDKPGPTQAGTAPATERKPAERPNPYTPSEICGTGYGVIDAHQVAGGVVYLLYQASSGRNCVATVKTSKVGQLTPAKAFLQVQGRSRAEDAGDFGYYAGPVRAEARKTCVKWGGEIGGSGGYASRTFEHCR